MNLLGKLVAAARGRRVPFALCYHGIGDETPESDPHGLMTTAAAFAEHLDVLQGAGYRLVGLDELCGALARGNADGLGAITFDDGLADTHYTAAELLAERGAVATAFLAPGLFGKDHPDLPPGRRILRSDEVAALPAFEIGAHSYSHADLPTLSRAEQLDELTRSRAELEELTGRPVTTMAYPFGRHDATTIACAREAGYTVACAVDGAGPWTPFSLPREPVFPSTSPARLRLKAAGLYGPVMALRQRLPA